MKSSMPPSIKKDVFLCGEDIYITNKKVSCAGEVKDSLHPKVYLRIKENDDKKKEVCCPYCGQKFIYLKNHDKPSSL